MKRITAHLAIIFLLFVVYLYLELFANTLACRVLLLPLLASLTWFYFNGFKLSLYLNYFLVFWLTFDWLHNYGGFGFVYPLVLIYLIWHLRAWQPDLSRRTSKVETALYFLFIIFLSGYIHEVFLLYTHHNLSLELRQARLYNSSHSVLLSLTLLFLYSYFSGPRGTYQSRQSVFFILSLVILWTVFSLVKKHEYFYVFAGKEQFALHPFFAYAQILLIAWLIAVLFYKCFFEKPKSYVFVSVSVLFFTVLAVYFLLGSVAVSKSWPEFDFLQTIQNQTVVETVFGHGYKWRGVFEDDSGYSSYQFPISLISFIFLEKGLIGILALLPASLLIAIELIHNRSINFLILIIIFTSALYFPILRDPLSIMLFAYLAAAEKDKAAISEKQYQHTPADIIFTKVLVFSLILLGAYLLLQTLQAGRKVITVSNNQETDTNIILPRHFIEILTVSEDVLFFKHFGVDFYRLKRVLLQSIKEGQYGKGGSTISMQLAKVRYLSFEKTLSRKAQQILIALYLESKKSKRQIINEYLASITFAPGVTGIKEAARYFYSKKVEDLNFEESLRIVMSIPDPYSYNAQMPISGKRLYMQSLQNRMAEFSFANTKLIDEYYKKEPSGR